MVLKIVINNEIRIMLVSVDSCRFGLYFKLKIEDVITVPQMCSCAKITARFSFYHTNPKNNFFLLSGNPNRHGLSLVLVLTLRNIKISDIGIGPQFSCSDLELKGYKIVCKG